MALDADQYLRTLQREYLDFIDDDVSVRMVEIRMFDNAMLWCSDIHYNLQYK